MSSTRAALILAAVLAVWFLGAHDLWTPDEPTYGEVAREMVVDGHWVVPHVNGAVYDHKPPLLFWLIALLSLPFGQVSELTARLPSALAAIGTVALTMRLGVRFYGSRVASLAGVVLATSYLFWERARACQMESLFCFFIWLSLAAFAEFRSGEASGRAAGLVFWAAAALAVLTKGPLGLIIPLGVVIATLLTDRQIARLSSLAPLIGLLIFGAVTGTWIAAAELWGPDGYSVWQALRQHFVQRGLVGMHHLAPPWFYLYMLPTLLLPWSGLLPGAVLLAWWRRRHDADRFLLTTAAFVVILFSLSAEKREIYVLPAFPAIALLIASLAGAVLGWRHTSDRSARTVDRRWVTIGQGVVGSLMILVSLALGVMSHLVHEVPLWTVAVSAALCLGMGGSTLWFAARGRPLRSIVATATGTTLIFLFATAVVYPMLDSVKSARPIAQALEHASGESRARGHDVVAFRTRNLPKAIAFYGNGLFTVETWDAAELARHLTQPAEVFAVLYAADLGDLGDVAADRVKVVYRTNLEGRELLVISNSQSQPKPP